MTTSTYEQNNFRNPLIGDGVGETQINVQAAMSLLKQLQCDNSGKGLELTPISNQGLHLFNICILQAIEYEMACRSDEE